MELAKAQRVKNDLTGNVASLIRCYEDRTAELSRAQQLAELYNKQLKLNTAQPRIDQETAEQAATKDNSTISSTAPSTATGTLYTMQDTMINLGSVISKPKVIMGALSILILGLKSNLPKAIAQLRVQLNAIVASLVKAIAAICRLGINKALPHLHALAAQVTSNEAAHIPG